MFKVIKARTIGNLFEWELDNGDTVLLTFRERADLWEGDLEDDYVFDGIEHNYHAVYSEVEYTDDTPEVLGFTQVG